MNLHEGTIFCRFARQILIPSVWILGSLKLTILHGPQLHSRLIIAAIDVTEIKPMGDQVDLFSVRQAAIKVFVCGRGASEWQTRLVLVVVIVLWHTYVETIWVSATTMTCLLGAHVVRGTGCEYQVVIDMLSKECKELGCGWEGTSGTMDSHGNLSCIGQLVACSRRLGTW